MKKEKTYTRGEVENILFTYAEQHALISTKSEADDFNAWVEQFFSENK